MEFEWDEGKDAANRAKHGVSLAEAARMDWTTGVDMPDLRFAYGEARLTRIAPIDGRKYVCIFTFRGRRIRVISLRKANAREARGHEQSDP